VSHPDLNPGGGFLLHETLARSIGSATIARGSATTMKHFLLAAVAALYFAPSIGFAQTPWPGNVVPGCRIAASDTNGFGENRTDAAIAGICTGIVVGIVPVGSFSSAPFRFCPPSEWTPRQAVKVFANYLAQHPAVLQEPASDLALAAFREAWPCRKK
jgi:hypothetical protein